MLTQRSARPSVTRLGGVKFPYGTEDQWSRTHVGGNVWELRLITPIHGTGADVTSDYSIPFYHSLMEIRFNHTTAADAASTDALNIYWYWSDGNPTWPLEYNIDGSADSSLILSYMDEGGKAFSPTVYRFITNTTNTDHIYVTMRVEVLKA